MFLSLRFFENALSPFRSKTLSYFHCDKIYRSSINFILFYIFFFHQIFILTTSSSTISSSFENLKIFSLPFTQNSITIKFFIKIKFIDPMPILFFHDFRIDFIFFQKSENFFSSLFSPLLEESRTFHYDFSKIKFIDPMPILFFRIFSFQKSENFFPLPFSPFHTKCRTFHEINRSNAKFRSKLFFKPVRIEAWSCPFFARHCCEKFICVVWSSFEPGSRINNINKSWCARCTPRANAVSRRVDWCTIAPRYKWRETVWPRCVVAWHTWRFQSLSAPLVTEHRLRPPVPPWWRVQGWGTNFLLSFARPLDTFNRWFTLKFQFLRESSRLPRLKHRKRYELFL